MPSMNRREACALLNVNPKRFKELIDAGVIPPGVGLGPRSLRWDRDELVATLRKHVESKPQADAA